MNGQPHHEIDEGDIAALNYLTSAQLESRYRSLTDEDPPARLGRPDLIVAVAYETVRRPHRRRTRHGA